MKRKANRTSLALLGTIALVLTALAFAAWSLQAQTPPSSSSDKPATPSNPPSAADTSSPSTPATTPVKPQTTQPKPAGVVWVNTQTGVYHKQGTRWYGKTKHGKYMLEADAVKAGYKPAA
jgi:hypothetical protein